MALFFAITPTHTYAINNEVSAAAEVIEITESKVIKVMDNDQVFQKLKVRITNGNELNKVVEIVNGDVPLANVIVYKVGDRVRVVKSEVVNQGESYVITDYVRSDALLLLIIIFLVLIIIITRGAGIGSIVSMGLTFWILFSFVLPAISNDGDPMLITFIASIIIIPVTYFLSHGWNKKTVAAIIGSIIALILTNILSYWFIEITKLTGLSSEDAGLLSVNRQGALNMKGILLAGIMIGTLGVLDDITISQSSIVSELSLTGKYKKATDLFNRAMMVGKDHITSMVNTLVLAYAGAALPLLLIFIDNPHPWSEVVNYEFIAEEIVRTLIGSIGLVIAVPITTYLASRMMKAK